MKTPSGYVEPFLVYVVQLTDNRGDATVESAGAFLSEREANRLIDLLESDGRAAIVNLVPVHRQLADWEYDR